MDLTRDDTETSRKPRHHLYRIDYDLFRQQTSYEANQLPYRDFGQLNAAIDNVEKAPDMYVDRHTP